MPLIGESAGTKWAVGYEDLHSASWDLDFPPMAAFIKVFLGMYHEFRDDKGAFDAGLINIRRRLPNGADETITFPYLGSFDSESVWFDAAMTHVTYGRRVRNCQVKLLWTLGRWG